MNQLYFEGKVVNLYAEDYQFLQDSVTDKVQSTIRYLISNHSQTCIVQGFTLTRNVLDPTKFDITHPTWNSKGAVITGEQLMYESSATYLSQSLKTYQPGSVVGIYTKLEYIYGSYDRAAGVLVENSRKAVDQYDNTLVYNRKLESLSLVQLTPAEFALLSAEDKLRHICLGQFTVLPNHTLSTPDYTLVHILTINVGEHTVTVDMLSYAFMLPQYMVLHTSTGAVNDNYYPGFGGDPMDANLQDNLNHVRTMIRDIKQTAHWDDVMEGVIGSVPEMNDLWKVGVFDHAHNHYNLTITSTGTVLVIASGTGLIGDTIKTKFVSTNLYVPTAASTTIGYWSGILPNPGTSGEIHTIGATPSSFTLNPCIDAYVNIDRDSFHMINENVRSRIYTMDDGIHPYPDFTLNTSTGVITSIVGGILGATTVECFYTYSAPRIDAVILDVTGVRYLVGTAAAIPTPPTLTYEQLPLYYIYRSPFKDYVEASDIVDVRISRGTNRELTEITPADIGCYDSLSAFHSTHQWSFHKYAVAVTSTGLLSPLNTGWSIVTTSTGDAVQLDPYYTYQTILHFQDNDELWLDVLMNSSPYTVTLSVEPVFNSGSFSDVYTLTVPTGSMLNRCTTPFLLNKGFNRGFYRVKLQCDSIFSLGRILLGKYDHYYEKDHMYSKHLAGDTLYAASAEIGAMSLNWITGFAYTLNNITVRADKIYKCLIPHTSGNFYGDLQAGYWIELSSSAESDARILSLQNEVHNAENIIADLQLETSILLNRKSSSSDFLLDLCNSEDENNMPISTAILKDDNAWNDNWTEANNSYFQGFVKPQEQYFMLETMDEFNLEGIGQPLKGAISYDSVNQCYWLISQVGANGVGEISKLSTNMKNGLVEVLYRCYIPAGGSSTYWDSITVDALGTQLYFVLSASAASYVYGISINADGTLGAAKYTVQNGGTIDLTAAHSCYAKSAADSTASSFITGVVDWSTTEIAYLLQATTTVTLKFLLKTDLTTGTSTTITGFGSYVGGSVNRYRSICKYNGYLYIKMDDTTDDKRFIYRFNTTTDIASHVVIRASGRFESVRNADGNGPGGITVGHQGDLLEVVSTASNGKFIARLCLASALWAENQCNTEIKISSAGGADNRAICLDGNYVWYSANNSVANSVKLVKRNLLTGAESSTTLTGGGWTYLYSMCLGTVSSTDYFYMLGNNGSYVSRAITRTEVEAYFGTNLDISIKGVPFTSYSTTDVSYGICNDGTYLYIINATAAAIDRWTLAVTPAKYTANYITLWAATTNWRDITYNNSKFYILDYTSGALSKIFVIDSSPVLNLASGKTARKLHRHQDPSNTVALTYGLAFNGNDLWCIQYSTQYIKSIKTLDDPDVTQLHTFVDINNALLSNNVACTTPVADRYFDPTYFTEILKFSNIVTTEQLFHGGYSLGSVNLSAGHNWATGNLSFTVATNSGTKTIMLTANCPTSLDVCNHINAVMLAISGANAEAFRMAPFSSGFIGIRSTVASDITVGVGTSNPVAMFGWVTAVTYANCYNVQTVYSRRNVPDNKYMAVGYDDEGFSLLHLDKYLSSKSVTGKPRYDVRNLRVQHYSHGAAVDGTLPTAATYNIMGNVISTAHTICIEKDMIFIGSQHTVNYGVVLLMINLKSGKVTNFGYQSNGTYNGLYYNGTLTERNAGKGYTGAINLELSPSSDSVQRIFARTFTKEDSSDFRGEYPKTYVTIGTDGGTDLLVIDWDANGSRTPIKLWNKCTHDEYRGRYAHWIAPSGTIFTGQYNANGNVMYVIPRVWEIQQDNIADAQMKEVGSSLLASDTLGISPNSRCWKTSAGTWRHQLIMSTAANTASIYLVDIENAKAEIITQYAMASHDIHYCDNSEDKVFGNYQYASTNIRGVMILKRYRFNDKNIGTTGAQTAANGWTPTYTNSAILTGDMYIDDSARPRFVACTKNASGTNNALRYAKDQMMLLTGSSTSGLQMFHFSQRDNTVYVSKKATVSSAANYLYKSFEQQGEV